MQHFQQTLDASKKQIRQRALISSPHVSKGHRPGLAITVTCYLPHFAVLVLVGTLAGCARSPLHEGDQPIDHGETWEIHYLNGVKTGYSVSRGEIVFENSRRLVRTTKRVIQGIQRFGDVTHQQLEYESFETTDGELIRCRWSLTSGSNVTTSTLTAHRDYLDIALESTGSRQVSRLAWQPNWRGYFAVEQSLQEQPMEPGEQRTLHALLPFFNQVAATQLVAHQWETTPLLDSQARLMRITCTQRIAEHEETVTLWLDGAGEIQKTEAVALGQVSYRTNSEIALREEANTDFDFGFASAVTLQGLDANPHEAQRAEYRIRMQRGDPSKVFADSRHQTVRRIEQHMADVIVTAEQEAGSSSGPFGEVSTAEYLETSHWIQSDDPEIQKLAARLAEVDKDPWAVAVAAEAMVHQYVRQRNFKQGMATAADVVRSAEGDCTEHAVLLAAICRARKIPARVAVGLVYSPATRSFAFHMWNEVWIANRWIALDATLGRGGIAGGHLKILDSALADTASVADLLPVLKVLGDLEIELRGID